MPVTITVRQVRDALFQHDLLSPDSELPDSQLPDSQLPDSQLPDSQANAEGGQSSNRLLGTLFHETFAALVDGSADTGWHAALTDEVPDQERWRETLRAHAYRRIVGRQLSRHEAALQNWSEPTCLYWTAVEELCDWICELVWTIHQASGQLPRPGQMVDTECRLEAELRQPGWREPVRLCGLADAIWRPPGRASWCVAELKLGRGHPEADLGQACLYHLLLRSRSAPAESAVRRAGSSASASGGEGNGEENGDPGTLALITFKPRRVEQLFSSDQLDRAQSRLLDLIGRLAGVTEAAGVTEKAEMTGVAEVAETPNTKTPNTETPLPNQAAVPVKEHPVANGSAFREQGAALLWTLAEYDAPAELVGEPIVGPTFVRFALRPAAGVRVRKIQGLANEIRIRLELEQPPFIGSEGGQLSVDIQRRDRQTVLFSEVEDQLPAVTPTGCSQLLVGVDLEGKLRFADLAEPDDCHLLVAGTTGSGKSEWLRAAIAGLLRTNTAATLRLLLIDPKRNAFNDLADSPLLWEPLVYPDERPVVEVLRRLVDEMERRYAVMDGADTLQEHVDRSGAALPRIVCVCDEYLDLVNRGRKERGEFEQQIVRLGAKARAAGIHLILATQQPSRETIRGALGSNIPARVALRTTHEIESRMVLNEAGAERLLGQGDLLFKDIGAPRRLQGIYLPPDERKRVFSSGP